jgi:hypothetical protein
LWGALSGVTVIEVIPNYGDSAGVHPWNETRNFCDRIFAFEVSAVLGEREVALEFEGWTVAEGGVEALGIVDGVDEEANGTPCVIDVPESAAVDFFRF